ncbi:fibronectin type III domain-containing protein [Hymenobacter properus]|uniref:Fibronectin type III domain-containing protein n=1 Tax=Hymenobacter properus TaxID=2791026 RepID=A0A931BHA8_9BACT|nr:fibronectin type III domain-containing protein [Hymenobacter properus]MBF9142461.1 fibronectin type III domain-containing protein [Hymenobacter properus]MBR7721268.1 fibronectin type III domain-containing protein [Microvirga sp. SRT04]
MKNIGTLLCWLITALLGTQLAAQAQCGTAVSYTGIPVFTATSATFSFAPVAGATSYTAECYTAGRFGQTFTITGSPVTFTDMLPGTRYTATIVAHCGSGSSSPMAAFGFSTLGPVGNCGYLGNVSASALTPTSATLNFTPLPGISSYQVWYHTAASGTTASPSVIVTGSPVTLTGLLPGTRYYYEIAGNCATGGFTPVYSGNFGTTSVSVCGTVTNVTVTATSSSTATVNYTPGNGNTQYSISWSAPGDSTHRTYSNGTSVVLTGLIPGRTYTVQVTSTCGSSGGTYTYSGNTNTTFNFRGVLATQPSLGGGTMAIYPNPVHHTATLVLPAVAGAEHAQVLLINALGQPVRTTKVPTAHAGETRVQLHLDGIAPGLYTVQILAGSQSASQRLVVE